MRGFVEREVLFKMTKGMVCNVLFICLIMLVFEFCSEWDGGMEEEEDYEVFVEAEDIFCTEVVLRVGLPDSGVAQDFNLVRDDSVVGVYCSSDNDTVIIDGGLMPDRDYEYRVDLVDGGRVRVSSESVVVHTLDTTSHEIQWYIDTLGIGGGYVNDVWIVNENDIYVVGMFRLPDPDSSWNGTGYEEFNAAHWNGEEWELLGIYSNTLDLYSIWYFDEDNIWVTDYCSPIHWDSKEWKLYHLQNMGLDVCAGFGVWASSSDDIYFVGRKGSIVHYDGKDFKKMESGTDIHLRGIWGLDKEHIWVVGTSRDHSRSIVLQKEGNGWKSIYYTQPHDGKPGGSYFDVWTDRPTRLYFNGLTGRGLMDLATGKVEKIDEPGQWAGLSIMGTECNDIFAVGQGSEVLHFNGKSWHLYRQFQELYSTYVEWRCVYVTKNVVVVGGIYPTLQWLPIVLRGYR